MAGEIQSGKDLTRPFVPLRKDSPLQHQSKGEAIVAFGVRGLQGGGVDAGFVVEELEELAGALDGGIGAGGVQDGAVADNVVDDDYGAGAGEF